MNKQSQAALASLLLASGSAVLPLTAIHAQQIRPTTAPPTPVQSRQADLSQAQLRAFVNQFQSDVYKGCMQTPRKDIKNPRGYCDCYAKSFTSRYTPQDLVALNNGARINRDNVNIITLLMAPEIRACTAANQ